MRTSICPHKFIFLRNTTLRSKTVITDVGKKVARVKWDWAGHVSCMHNDRQRSQHDGCLRMDGAAEAGLERGGEMI